MKTYDIVMRARSILGDNNINDYRFTDSYFKGVLNECFNEIYSFDISKFLDSYGKAEKKEDYVISLPSKVETEYAIGDIVFVGDDDFICTQAGKTNSIPPEYNLGYEEITTDGSCIFTYLDENKLPFLERDLLYIAYYLCARANENIGNIDQFNFYMEKYILWLQN